jgi:membrane protease YdiL (CAAX protease family)
MALTSLGSAEPGFFIMQLRAIQAPVIAILLIQLLALLLRSNLQLKLIEGGHGTDYARDLSYLLVPPLLAVLLWPILRSSKNTVKSWFDPGGLTVRLVLTAVAIGILARVAWWCQLVAGIALGITVDSRVAAPSGPQFWFNCPPLTEFMVGLLVWVCLIPIVEEFVHRGLIQSALHSRGRCTAIVVSAFLFAAFHPPSAMPLAFTLGLVFAIQFARSGMLWASTISHAAYDGLIQFDWRCLHGTWNPRVTDSSLPDIATLSIVGFVLAAGGIVWLVSGIGAPSAPRSRN